MKSRNYLDENGFSLNVILKIASYLSDHDENAKLAFLKSSPQVLKHYPALKYESRFDVDSLKAHIYELNKPSEPREHENPRSPIEEMIVVFAIIACCIKLFASHPVATSIATGVGLTLLGRDFYRMYKENAMRAKEVDKLRDLEDKLQNKLF